MRSETRRSPRFPFYASAEILELETRTRLTTRTSELSQHGAYMDMMNPLPLGTAVQIRITYNEQTLETKGRVIYSQANMGMGVAFDEVEEEQEAILEKWLEGLRGSTP